MYLLANVDSYRRPIGAVTEDPIYFLDLLPLASLGIATISSDQRLSLFDTSALARGPLRTVDTPHGNIAVARVFDPAGGAVCTAGSDGTLCIWDLRSSLSGPALELKQIQQPVCGQETCDVALVLTGKPAWIGSSEATRASVEALACSVESNLVASGTEFVNCQASVQIWDVRSTSSPVVQFNEVHSDDITELSFHPTDMHVLLSGSTDGLVNIYDLRITDEDEVVIQTFNHGASIHRASFLNKSEVFALSHDEKLALYDVAEEQENGDATINFGDMREVVHCQYVANVLPKPNRGSIAAPAAAVIGAGSQDRERFDLIHLSRGLPSEEATWSLDSGSMVSLERAHGREIVRAFRVFDEDRVVFTAGEDGQIKAWRPGS